MALSPAQATTLPSTLRNSIYSTLLSTGGIRTIEATLTQLLQSTGFHAELRAYITDLFRTGQATTANDAFDLAMLRIKECMAAKSENEDEREMERERERETGDLRLPDEVVREGSRVVKKELERVVVIEVD